MCHYFRIMLICVSFYKFNRLSKAQFCNFLIIVFSYCTILQYVSVVSLRIHFNAYGFFLKNLQIGGCIIRPFVSIKNIRNYNIFIITIFNNIGTPNLVFLGTTYSNWIYEV